MSLIKTEKEIEILKQGGKKLSRILNSVVKKAKPGVNTAELNALATKLIFENGGEPSFLHYGRPPYPATLCTSVNEQLVHGIPGNYALKSGDILSLDIGMKYPAVGGLYTDMAVTIAIGKVDKQIKHLLKVTRAALDIWVDNVKPGRFLNDIARLVESSIEKNGMSVIRDYAGHGVGHAVHEEPLVPNYYAERPRIELKAGMVLAFEPMVALGMANTKTLGDRWTVVMTDGSTCAHFEHTVAVTKKGCKVLTK
ncbi:MAG: type I methionyl aminopeptidase [Parcubacteria group bacterium]